MYVGRKQAWWTYAVRAVFVGPLLLPDWKSHKTNRRE